MSCPVLSCPVLSCPVLSCPVLSCPVLSCPSRSVSFCSFLICYLPFCSVLLSSASSVLFCFVLFCSVLLSSVLFSSVQLCFLAISQLRTAKHLWIVWGETQSGRKLKLNSSLSLKKTSKVVYTIHSMSHDWCSLSHCPSKQSMHALRF